MSNQLNSESDFMRLIQVEQALNKAMAERERLMRVVENQASVIKDLMKWVNKTAPAPTNESR